MADYRAVKRINGVKKLNVTPYTDENGALGTTLELVVEGNQITIMLDPTTRTAVMDNQGQIGYYTVDFRAETLEATLIRTKELINSGLGGVLAGPTTYGGKIVVETYTNSYVMNNAFATEYGSFDQTAGNTQITWHGNWETPTSAT